MPSFLLQKPGKRNCACIKFYLKITTCHEIDTKRRKSIVLSGKIN